MSVVELQLWEALKSHSCSRKQQQHWDHLSLPSLFRHAGETFSMIEVGLGQVRACNSRRRYWIEEFDIPPLLQRQLVVFLAQ